MSGYSPKCLFSLADGRALPLPYPINVIFAVMTYLPLSWRKLVLQYCRVQRNIYTNKGLRRLYDDIRNTVDKNTVPSVAIPDSLVDFLRDEKCDFLTRKGDVTLHRFVSSINSIRTPLQISFLSFITRVESFDNPAIPEQVMLDSMEKELGAAMNHQDMSERWPINFDVLSDPTGPGGRAETAWVTSQGYRYHSPTIRQLVL